MKEKQTNIENIKSNKIETTKMVLGLVLILTSLFIALAIASYFFTGGADQSLVEHLDVNVDEELKAQIRNWTGYRGAILSNFLVAKTFGVPILFLVYFLCRLGLKLTNYVNLNTFQTFGNCIFFTIWTSFLLSFLGLENSYFNFGGLCGKFETNWVEAQIGMPGAFLLLLFSLVIFLYTCKGVSFVQMKDNTLSFFNKVQFWKRFNGEKGSEDVEENTDTILAVDDTRTAAETVVEELEPEASNNESIEETDSLDDEDLDVDAIEEQNNQENNEETISDGEVKFTITKPEDDLAIVENSESVSDDNESSDNLDIDKEYQDLMERMGPYDPTAELPDFKLPTLDLLEDYPISSVLDEEEQNENKNRIIQVLKNFGIQIDSVSATVGPTITLYEIVPAPGVRISKIQSLEKDIALSLAAKGIRIIAPIPGKGTVGIEVPNKKPQIVSMKSVLASKAFQESKYELPIAFGRTITNEVFMVDLAKTPHLLVAGATGMGKSVGLNVLLTSLLYKKHPATLKLVMVDPKQVEFSIYEKIEKHYLAKLPGDSSAIITDTTKVVQTLTSLTTEMENRYTLLADVHLRNIKEYNAKFISRKINPAKELPNGLSHHYLPYIVVIIDEYGDLLMTAGKEIETPIARIAQKARAVGIHMVIATQRPSVKIVTGTIKANFPARLAFRVASRIDSQTILDAPGAQELVGKGDMLYSTGGAENTRVQCAFVDTPEVESINDFINEQHGYPEAYRLPEYVDENGEVVGAATVDTKSLDPRLREAAELVVGSQNGSTSSIQRTLEVGFNRAGRIMDQLEAIGVVGPVCGSKPRSVLVQYLDDLDMIFKNISK